MPRLRPVPVADPQVVLRQRALYPRYQPILSFQSGAISGFEGCVRGPVDSPLHEPEQLIAAARRAGLAEPMERLCREVAIESFVLQQLPGQLFLKVFPGARLDDEVAHLVEFLRRVRLEPAQVVLQFPDPGSDGMDALLEAAAQFRPFGFAIAVDRLGERFASVRLWSELRPDFVKIDRAFTAGIDQDRIKLQVVRSIQQIADSCGTSVIVQGLETEGEFLVARDLNIKLGQGYFIAHPDPLPARIVPRAAFRALTAPGVGVFGEPERLAKGGVSAEKLLIHVSPVSPDDRSADVYRLFEAYPGLHALPVVDQGFPVGLISRARLLDHFARPNWRETHGDNPCRGVMDPSPLIVDRGIAIQDLSRALAESERRHLADGFIITENGLYAGMGTGQDLMQEITKMQLNAARYANPLTLLPGNVPIDEQIDRLLASRAPFWACYADLDGFKGFNDVFGYRRGDEVIQLAARALSACCVPAMDFLGHIGGDDFILLMQSTDWERRCREALDNFAQLITSFFSAEQLARGGFIGEDRQGREVLHAIPSISIGVVPVTAGDYESHQELAAAASEAKKQAKRIPGNSLFVERRRPSRLAPPLELRVPVENTLGMH